MSIAKENWPCNNDICLDFTQYRSHFAPANDTPYLALTGKLWGVCCEFSKKIDHIIMRLCCIIVLNRKSHHFDDIFFTDCTKSCHFTTFGAVSDENVIKMTTFPFHLGFHSPFLGDFYHELLVWSRELELGGSLAHPLESLPHTHGGVRWRGEEGV